MPGINRTVWWILLGILANTCVEPFTPDVTRYDNILVVDGLITNLVEPNVVELTRSIPYEEKVPTPVTGATVLILDESDNIITLEETVSGKYATNPETFTGIEGKKYKVFIITPEGEEYESDYVEVKPSPRIDTVYYRYEKRETSDPDEYLEGVQVFLSTHDPDNSTWYYRWEWLETWEFVTPVIASDRVHLHRCWRSEPSANINVATTKRLSSDVVIDYPLYFISQKSSRLSIMYSALIRQYTLSQDAFNFWKNIETINQKMGSLFDPIPTSVSGNIYSVDDPERPVLGYFQASSVTTKRIFIDRGDLPPDMRIATDYEFCELNFLENPTVSGVEAALKNGWIFVDSMSIGPSVFYRFVNLQSCFNCTTRGTNHRPDYWPSSNDK